MTIDWDSLQASIDSEIEAAATETSTCLASQASSLTKLSDDEIKQLFPTPEDVQKLKSLMDIVKSSEDENTKVNRLVNNMQDLGGTAIKIINAIA